MFHSSTCVDCILYLSFLISTTSAQGQLAQFLDSECNEASPINPIVNLPLNTCLVTEGAGGLVVEIYPACTTGNTALQLYADTSCARPDSYAGDVENNCYWYGGAGIPAAMFICGSVADGDSHATSTTTVSAGSVLVPVAQATETTTSATLVAPLCKVRLVRMGLLHPPQRCLRHRIPHKRTQAVQAVTQARDYHNMTRLYSVSPFPPVRF